MEVRPFIMTSSADWIALSELLAAGQFQSAVSHHGIVSLRLLSDEFVDACDPTGIFNFFLRRVFFRVQKVLPDRSVE